MFLHYYVDVRPHHKHQVHHEGCDHMPQMEYRQYLGMFEACAKAVAMAKVIYSTAVGCRSCEKAHVKPAERLRR